MLSKPAIKQIMLTKVATAKNSNVMSPGIEIGIELDMVRYASNAEKTFIPKFIPPVAKQIV